MTKQLLWGCLLLLLTGCGRSPQTQFYTLVPTVPPATSGLHASNSPTVAIAAVTLPELVDRPQLVVIPDGDTRVAMLESRRWAEPLKTAIPRILAENLSRRLGAGHVAFTRQHAAAEATCRMFVDFQRFEATGSAVLVDALWTIRCPGTTELLQHQSRLKEPVTETGYDQLVAAYSRALGRLAQDMAEVLSVK